MFEYALNKLKRDLFLHSFFLQYKNNLPIPPPGHVIWDCTRSCNLKCLHCGATKEKYSSQLSQSQIQQLIDEFSKMGVRTFSTTGGEPLLRSDLLKILEFASQKGLNTGIATNGYFITRQIARNIKDAGVSSIQISLDGTKEIHDNIRGDNESYDRVIEAVSYLQEVKIKSITIATTVTPLNIGILNDMKKLLSQLSINMWRISTVMCIGRAEKNHDLLLSDFLMRQLLQFVSSSKKELNIVMAENLPFLGEYERRARASPMICPVGISTCCIGVDGNIRGCPEQPDTDEFREGSILNESFSNIWTNQFKRYRDRIIFKQDVKCRKCKDKDLCFGGCWVMRKTNTHCIHNLLDF